MSGFIDIHSHFLPAVDDGVRTVHESIALLRALSQAGFSHVVATPHIRPAMFPNNATSLRQAYALLLSQISNEPNLPSALSLAAEHFLDDEVFQILMRNEGLKYGKGRSALIEFSPEQIPHALHARLFDLRKQRIRPVIAHPERYQFFWQNPKAMAETIRRAGGVLLLDIAALEGKYGRKAQQTAETLVELHAYYAACSDAHRPEDVECVERSIKKLRTQWGEHELVRLLQQGPQEILDGCILDEYD